MKTDGKKTRLISLTAAAALCMGAALPFGAAHAGGAVCYKPVADDWAKGMERLAQDGSLSSLTGGDSLLLSQSMGKSNTTNGNGENGIPIRLVYSAQRGGKLTTRSNKFGHGEQTTYDANGKVTNLAGPYTMQMFTGSAIKTRSAKDPSPNGARLAGEISAIRLGKDIGLSLPLEIDCTTPYTTVTPGYWQCHFTAVVIGFPVILEQVNINKDPYCSIFQDGVVRHEPVVLPD